METNTAMKYVKCTYGTGYVTSSIKNIFVRVEKLNSKAMIKQSPEKKCDKVICNK